MGYAQLFSDINSAREGNEITRQQLINNHKPFIINAVSHICKRYVTWSDEEASIGLLAFNRAIDTFASDGGRKFLSFCYLLINRDLISWFRRNNKDIELLSMDFTDEASPLTAIEIEKSMQYYHEKIETEELIEEILELDRILEQYNIKFEELEEACPKHKDTREMLDKIVMEFIQDRELINEMTKKKRFPAAVFVKKTGYALKTVERYRKCLITMIVINLHPEWTHLSSYARVTQERRGPAYV